MAKMRDGGAVWPPVKKVRALPFFFSSHFCQLKGKDDVRIKVFLVEHYHLSKCSKLTTD